MTSPSPGRPRPVFDCNTLIQATTFDDGPAAACVRLMDVGRVEVFVSRATLSELRRVLKYENVLGISAQITPARASAFLQRLAFRATLVRHVRHAIDYPRDPADEPYIDLAATVKADYLVSRDRDLLSLMTGHSALCRQFRRLTRPLQVVDPVTFLRTMRSRHPE